MRHQCSKKEPIHKEGHAEKKLKSSLLKGQLTKYCTERLNLRKDKYSVAKVMSPKGLPVKMDPLKSQKATRDELMSEVSKGVVASSSAMAGEETVREVRGEAAKEGKKQRRRDEAKAKSQQDDAEEVHEPEEPEADDVHSMFSPIEHDGDDEEQSAGQD